MLKDIKLNNKRIINIKDFDFENQVNKFQYSTEELNDIDKYISSSKNKINFLFKKIRIIAENKYAK